MSVPTNTQRDIDLQRPLLNVVRESQAAVIDVGPGPTSASI